jgi:hypothetical protein
MLSLADGWGLLRARQTAWASARLSSLARSYTDTAGEYIKAGEIEPDLGSARDATPRRAGDLLLVADLGSPSGRPSSICAGRGASQRRGYVHAGRAVRAVAHGIIVGGGWAASGINS